MEKFDLAAALLAYRKEKKLSLQKMGQILCMSKSAYNRLEKGITKPTYDQVPWILKLLDLEIEGIRIEAVPPPDPKWYRAKQWRWIIPILISYITLSFFAELNGFQEAYGGKDYLMAHYPYKAFFVIGAVFCGIYWYFLPPALPKRFPTLREIWISAAVGITVFVLIFHELFSPVLLQFRESYLKGLSSGPWIVAILLLGIAFISIWGLKKTKLLN